MTVVSVADCAKGYVRTVRYPWSMADRFGGLESASIAWGASTGVRRRPSSTRAVLGVGPATSINASGYVSARAHVPAYQISKTWTTCFNPQVSSPMYRASDSPERYGQPYPRTQPLPGRRRVRHRCRSSCRVRYGRPIPVSSRPMRRPRCIP